jgi:hypothetical protein
VIIRFLDIVGIIYHLCLNCFFFLSEMYGMFVMSGDTCYKLFIFVFCFIRQIYPLYMFFCISHVPTCVHILSRVIQHHAIVQLLNLQYYYKTAFDGLGSSYQTILMINRNMYTSRYVGDTKKHI